MIINPSETDMSMFITAAMRYALGRQTYAVGCICRVLIKLAPEMQPKEKEFVAREITHAISVGKAGDFCDVQEWKRVMEAMEA